MARGNKKQKSSDNHKTKFVVIGIIGAIMLCFLTPNNPQYSIII